MRRRTGLVAVIPAFCLFLVWGHAARAQTDAREMAAAGVLAYDSALETRDRGARLNGFRQAERFFQSAAESPDATAWVEVNLGNAALAGERLGPAVLAYRRAQLTDRTNLRAEQNLAYARSLLPAWVPKPAPKESFRDLPAAYGRWALGLGSLRLAGIFALAALGLVAGIRFEKSGLYALAALLGAGWFMLCVLAVFAVEGSDAREAVVTADEVTVRSADSLLSPVALSRPLPGGTEVEILEDRSPWARVRLGTGRDVWLQESSITRLEENRR